MSVLKIGAMVPGGHVLLSTWNALKGQIDQPAAVVDGLQSPHHDGQ